MSFFQFFQVTTEKFLWIMHWAADEARCSEVPLVHWRKLDERNMHGKEKTITAGMVSEF